MAAYIAIFLSLICIVLLSIIIIKFKKLFSTEAIIEKTKNQMNKIIADINQNANMDIELINNATKRIRDLMKESEQHMSEFQEAARILRDLISKVKTDDKVDFVNNPIYMDSLGLGVNDSKENINFNSNPDDNIKNKNNNKTNNFAANAYKMNQQSLFDHTDDEINKDNSNETVENNKLNLIPKIITNIIPDSQENVKLTLDERVRKLHASGMDVDEIARKLKCSTAEVQFIIEMYN